MPSSPICLPSSIAQHQQPKLRCPHPLCLPSGRFPVAQRAAVPFCITTPADCSLAAIRPRTKRSTQLQQTLCSRPQNTVCHPPQLLSTQADTRPSPLLQSLPHSYTISSSKAVTDSPPIYVQRPAPAFKRSASALLLNLPTTRHLARVKQQHGLLQSIAASLGPMDSNELCKYIQVNWCHPSSPLIS